MLPYLEEIAREKAGIDSEGFLQIIAISQSFPGAMGINGAGIIGYRLGGWKGAILAITLIAAPGVICAAVLFYTIGWLSSFAWFSAILTMLKAALIGIIIGMVLNLGTKSIRGLKEIAMALLAFLLFFFYKINPVFLLAGAGFLGLMVLKPARDLEK